MSERLFKHLPELGDDYREWATSDAPRIGIGYPVMDSRTNGGAAAGEVIFFVARPSVGKTAFALNVVANNPLVPALMFSVEMHGRYIAARLAAMTTRTSTASIERDLKQWGRSNALDETIGRYQHFGVVDAPSLSMSAMSRGFEEATEAWGFPPRFTIVDYLELIEGHDATAVEAVDKTAVAMKAWARKHDTVLLVLHQVSREQGGNGEKPLGLRSGRYGGEQAADYFLAAYRPCLNPNITMEEYSLTQHQWYLQFLKNRAGGDIHPVGVQHYFDPVSLLITDSPLGQPHLQTTLMGA